MEYFESITALPQSIPFQVSAIVVKPPHHHHNEVWRCSKDNLVTISILAF
jgi:hypothetical protein